MIEFLVETSLFYTLVGVVFALAFAWRGAAAVDPVARHGTLGFRMLIVPGAALLWPLLAVRWWRAGEGIAPPGERTDRWQPASERLRSRALIAWIALAPVIALVLVVALRARAGVSPRSRDAGRLPVPTDTPGGVR